MTFKFQKTFPAWRGLEDPNTIIEFAQQHLSVRLRGNPPYLSDTWFERFESLHSEQSAMRGYSYFSDEVRRHLFALRHEEQEHALKQLLIWHARRFISRRNLFPLPEEFYYHVLDSIIRICEGIGNDSYTCNLNSDSFAKDLGILRGGVIPALAQLIYPSSGVTRSMVLKNGFGCAWHLIVRCGGLSPFLEIHTHDAMAKHYFNEAGWNETYRLAATLLKYFPNSRGLLGSSWFYDPKIQEISPRLAYLQLIPRERGGRFFRVGSSQSDIDLATATSSSRRELVSKGLYRPTKYALVWARADLAQFLNSGN